MEGLLKLWAQSGFVNWEFEQLIMVAVGATLIFLAIRKGFEPLLLLPIGFGTILSNIPVAGMAEVNGLLYMAVSYTHLTLPTKRIV